MVSKGYTFGDENVYVSQSKRIRFERKNVYVSGTKRIRLGQVPNLPHQGTELSRFSLDEWKRRRRYFASALLVGRLLLFLWWTEGLPLDLVKAVHHAVRAPFYVGSPIIIRIFTPHTCSVQY